MCSSAPRLDLDSPESGYHGLVKENETLVEVTPQIRAIGAKVCSFRIANKHHGEAPFEIVLKEKGMAELRALRVLNCEKRRNYKFDIEAVGCNGSLSEKYELLNKFKHLTNVIHFSFRYNICKCMYSIIFFKRFSINKMIILLAIGLIISIFKRFDIKVFNRRSIRIKILDIHTNSKAMYRIKNHSISYKSIDIRLMF